MVFRGIKIAVTSWGKSSREKGILQDVNLIKGVLLWGPA
jgi:hypothetical protein